MENASVIVIENTVSRKGMKSSTDGRRTTGFPGLHRQFRSLSPDIAWGEDLETGQCRNSSIDLFTLSLRSCRLSPWCLKWVCYRDQSVMPYFDYFGTSKRNDLLFGK